MNKAQPNPYCEFCNGYGDVHYPVFDPDTHSYIPVGVRDCVCVTGYPKNELTDTDELHYVEKVNIPDFYRSL